MIVTYYSFKGGVGRSMAVANCAEILADGGYDVIFCDWDLEAPGLEHYAVSAPRQMRRYLEAPGVMDLLLDYRRTASAASENSVSKPVVDQEGEAMYRQFGKMRLRRPSSYALEAPARRERRGRLRLLTAGRRDDAFYQAYTKAVQEFDWLKFYTDWAGGSYMEFFRKDLEQACDIVLIDSRTGITEHGGVSTHHLADLVVVLTASNDLNLSGSRWMARTLSNPDLTELRGGRPLHIIPVAARIEQTAEKEELVQFRRRLVKEFAGYVPTSIGNPEEFLYETEIPYMPYYSFTERVVAREPKEKRETRLYEAYHRLTETIARWGETAGLINPTGLVEKSLRPVALPLAAASKEVSRIYVSYPVADQKVVYQFLRNLESYCGENVKFIHSSEALPGSDWRNWIYDRIAEADAFFLVISGGQNDWQSCLFEVGLYSGTKEKPRLIVFHPTDMEPPHPLKSFQAVRLEPNHLVRFLKRFFGSAEWTNRSRPINREIAENPAALSDIAGELAQLFSSNLTQINIANLNLTPPISPTQTDPEILRENEAAFRRRVRKRFEDDAPYYIELTGEITEKAAAADDRNASRSARRRRKLMNVEYRELIQEGREDIRVKVKTLRETVDKYPCVILLGDPGCGKTTALQHLAYELAEVNDELPVPLRLSEFEPGMTVEDFIINGWAGPEGSGHWNAPELANNLAGYLNEGNLFCLFDALNEMPHKGYAERARALRNFISKWSTQGNHFLVTCRVLDYGEELSGLQRVEIQPLGNGQIENFLQRELPSDWEALWKELTKDGDSQRSLLELARNPYMMAVIIDVYAEEGRLSLKPAELMDFFLDILMNWSKEKCPPEEWLDVDVQRQALAVMAFEIQDRTGFGTMVKTAQAKAVMPTQIQPDPNWPPVPSPPDQVLNLAASAHIIEMTGDKSSLRFYHQLLQQYFAAREMLKRDPAGLDKLWRWPWLEKEMPKWVRPEGSRDPLPPPPHTNWEETTIMAAGLMPENDDQLLRAVIKVNPVLAGRCLHEGQAKVERNIRHAVVDRLLDTISNSDVALRVRIAAGDVLGYLGDPRLGELVTIAAEKFLMGDDQDDNAKPQHKVFLPEYQIGKYPVTNAEFVEFIKAGGYNDKRWWTAAGWATKEEENWTEPRLWTDTRFNKPNQPVVGVSWYESLAYCRWLCAKTGQPYRMPSEAEWEKAARGTDGRQYPWGKRFDPSHLNSWEGDQRVGSTTPVGIYPTGASFCDCQDIAGNVWEWTSSQYRIYPYNPDDGRENLDAGNDALRVLRGGSWYHNRVDTQCSYRGWSYPSGRDDFIGFRVLVSPISAL